MGEKKRGKKKGHVCPPLFITWQKSWCFHSVAPGFYSSEKGKEEEDGQEGQGYAKGLLWFAWTLGAPLYQLHLIFRALNIIRLPGMGEIDRL